MRLAYRLITASHRTGLDEARRSTPTPCGLEPGQDAAWQYLLALKHHRRCWTSWIPPGKGAHPHQSLPAGLPCGLGERSRPLPAQGGLEAEAGDLNESQAKGVKIQIRGLLKELEEV